MFVKTRVFSIVRRGIAPILACAGLLAPLQSAVAQDSLFPSRAYPTGGINTQCVFADFDGDGIPDALTTDYNNPVFHILRGTNGNGFQQVLSFAGYANPVHVAAADLNGDGKADVITMRSIVQNSAYSYFVTVTLSDSGNSLSFQMPQDYAMTDKGVLALGDVNGDGKPDIVVTNFTNNTVGVLLNNGNGTFGTPHYFAVGIDPNLVALGDMNGDGKLDIVTANANDKTIRVLNGQGNGNFTPGFVTTLPAATPALLLADVDGDGKLDIVYDDTTPTTLPNSDTLLRILHNAGSGTFTAGASYEVGTNVEAILFQDANGDGKPDLFTFNHDNYENPDISVLMNGGGGQFAAQIRTPAVAATDTKFIPNLTLLDVNGDGKRDLVCFTLTGLVTLLGHGDGTFENWNLVGLGGGGISLAVGDLNNDHIPDVVAYDFGYSQVSFLLGKGDGTFFPSGGVSAIAYPTGCLITDVNRDGNPDVILANYTDGTLTLFLSSPLGFLQSRTTVTVGGRPVSIATADFNADGNPDLVVNDYDNNRLDVLLGNGLGGFPTLRYVSAGNKPGGMEVGDFNHDGHPDIAVGNHDDNRITILNGVGNGNFVAGQSLIFNGKSDTIVAADLNGDGWLDLVVGASDAGGVYVYYGQSNGTFSNPSRYDYGLNISQIAIKDMDGDGKPDLLVGDYISSTVHLFLNDGYGDFGVEQVYYSPVGVGGVAAADMDNDGKPDIVTSALRAVGVLLQKNPDAVTVSGNVTLEGIASNPNAPRQEIFFTFLPTHGGNPVVRPAQVGPDGNFTVASIPKNAYVAHIKGVKYLAVDTLVNATKGDVSNLTAYLHTGDVDNNNVVDIEDFGFLVDSYGSVIDDGTFLYDDRADFNGDGRIDIADFGYLVANYGSMGDP